MVLRSLSIPTRIFLGFAVLIASVAILGGTSLAQHDRTARTLRLLHEGYLPLTLTLGEAKATQAVFTSLLERVRETREGEANEAWLVAARQVRPATLRRANHALVRAERLATTDDDRAAVTRMQNDLTRVSALFVENDAEFDALALALRRGDERAIEARVTTARAKEIEIQEHYRRAFRELQERIGIVAAEAASSERRTAVLLFLLTLISLALGALVTWQSYRVLRPLPRLHARVQAIARGASSEALTSESDDELGRLTREFERMVEALAARDQNLRDAAEKELALLRVQEQTNARLVESERLAAIGRMAAHVTHEVRNPLSSIGLNVEMLADELPEDASEARALMAAIHREIDRLRAVTEEYLRLARVPSPKLETIDLAEVVREIVSFSKREMDAAGVSLDVHVENDVSDVVGDSAQLRQAVVNLLRNAREAQPSGGAIVLDVGTERAGVFVRVRDRGPGMSEDVVAHVFDLFFSTKEKGTGLGLSLVQQIVTAHGGTIRCESSPGQGTVFYLCLPAAESVVFERSHA